MRIGLTLPTMTPGLSRDTLLQWIRRIDEGPFATLATGERIAPLAMTGEEFRRLGHRLVDDVAALLDGLPARPVTPGESPQQIRRLLGTDRMPERGAPAAQLLPEVTQLLVDHSLYNGHPRFWGYITASPAPIGILGDLLAAAINPNVGAAILSPGSTATIEHPRRASDRVAWPVPQPTSRIDERSSIPQLARRSAMSSSG